MARTISIAKGKSTYKYARAGKDNVLEPYEVLIKNIKIISYDYPTLALHIITRPGVYIRSLAKDIGRELLEPVPILQIWNGLE